MQLLLPLFSSECKMISDRLGVYEQDELVQYIVSGLPVFSHGKDDLQGFRFITSNFIKQGLCTQAEIIRCFCISEDSVWRSLKKLRTEGESAFFSLEQRHGYCHKIKGEKKKRIQKALDSGLSNNAIAKKEKLSEGAIRYAIMQGHLKKNN